MKIEFAETLAVGDGANDLAMIQKAGMGVAYHAKPVVAAAADVAIQHNDLTALLYLQGYSDDDEIVQKRLSPTCHSRRARADSEREGVPSGSVGMNPGG